MTMDAIPQSSARDEDAAGMPSARFDGHMLISLAVLVSAAGLLVFLVRTLEWPNEIAGMSGAAFVAAALLIHLAVAHATRSATRRDKGDARGLRRQARRQMTATDVSANTRVEPVLPPRHPAAPSAVTAADAIPDWQQALARLPDMPAETTQADADLGTIIAAAHELRPRPDMPPAVPPTSHAVRTEPAIRPEPIVTSQTAPSDPPYRASLIDENEVQRVERLVKKLADDVRLIEATAAAAERRGAHTLEAAGAPPLARQATGNATDPAMQIAASISALRRNLPDAPPPIAADMPPAAASAAGQAPRWSAYTAQPQSAPLPETTRDEILLALNAQRIDVYLEPILDIRDQRPQHYQVSIGLRSIDGTTIDLGQAERRLGGTGLLPLLDQTRIVQAAGLAERLAERGKTGSLITDVHGETLSDGAFRAAFTDHRRRVGAFPGHLVLALPQADVQLFATADWQTLERLHAAGFGFALTDITSLDMDFATLATRGFVMARLDAETFLVGLPADAGVMVPPGDICRHLAASGLALVVGGILDDAQLARIFGFGVLFGQGKVFGGPRAVKSQVGDRQDAGDGATASH
jgi:cyclic-di-GMP phosphodiesterase TipF (flagellum assembly factor)